MKFNWCAYLKLAQDLSVELGNPSSQVTDFALTDGDLTQAKMRCIVSRAYYSAFCLSRNYLRDIVQDPSLRSTRRQPDFNEHAYVIEEFKLSRDPNFQQIGRSLERLRIDRNRADYDDIFAVSNLGSTVKVAISSAQKIVGLIEKIQNS